MSFEPTSKDVQYVGFEKVLRGIFNKGDCFCSRCMDMLSSHIDIDSLIGDNFEREQNPTKQKQKPFLEQVDLRPLHYAPRPTRKGREKSRPDSPNITIPSSVPPVPAKIKEVPYPVFEQEKYDKLCQLLEKSINLAENPKPAPPTLVQAPPPQAPAKLEPQKPHPLTENMLAERIRVLTEELHLKDGVLGQYETAITKLCQKSKKIQRQNESQPQLQVQLEIKNNQIKLLEEQNKSYRQKFLRLIKKFEYLKKEIMLYSGKVGKDIDTDYKTITELIGQNKLLRGQLDEIFAGFDEASWEKAENELKGRASGNYFGRSIFKPR